MLKNMFDKSIACFFLLLLSPLLLLICLFLRVLYGAPVLFCQQRPGHHGKPFLMYKFRTMNNTREESGKMLSDEQRITFFGRLLRASSMDELPELFNVLMGDMSLVGPRPLLMEYLTLYTPEQARRHEVKPGITGWAQVNGRNCISWEKKFSLDVWYVDNRSLSLDCKIMAMTLVKVIKREGISQEGKTTMTKFMGSDSEKS